MLQLFYISTWQGRNTVSTGVSYRYEICLFLKLVVFQVTDGTILTAYWLLIFINLPKSWKVQGFRIILLLQRCNAVKLGFQKCQFFYSLLFSLKCWNTRFTLVYVDFCLHKTVKLQKKKCFCTSATPT